MWQPSRARERGVACQPAGPPGRRPAPVTALPRPRDQKLGRDRPAVYHAALHAERAARLPGVRTAPQQGKGPQGRTARAHLGTSQPRHPSRAAMQFLRHSKIAITSYTEVVSSASRGSIPQARRPARVLRPLLHLQKKSPVPGSESGLDLRLWSPVTESNRRPSPYHGDALPTELTGPTYYGVAP